MSAATLPRVFRYNSVELEDPGLEHDPVDVRNLYSATYPEITSAAIEGPEVKDGKRVYTFRKAVGTKGADDELARLNAYRAALINLCEQNGGSLVVKTPNVTVAGSLLWRWIPDGLEFRFVKDGILS